jgi:hypothetical protein
MALHLWLMGSNIVIMQRLMGWSRKTVINYLGNFSKLVSQVVTDYYENIEWDNLVTCQAQIGGPGRTVQLRTSRGNKVGVRRHINRTR